MNTVTFDTTVKPNSSLASRARRAGWDVAFASVSVREAEGTDFEVTLKQERYLPELGTWDESGWGDARWANEKDSKLVENIISIIANGSFPKHRARLSRGQVHQLRDAMIIEAHASSGRDVFVTDDEKGFIKQGRRAALERLLSTRIVTSNEFCAELAGSANGV